MDVPKIHRDFGSYYWDQLKATGPKTLVESAALLGLRHLSRLNHGFDSPWGTLALSALARGLSHQMFGGGERTVSGLLQGSFGMVPQSLLEAAYGTLGAGYRATEASMRNRTNSDLAEYAYLFGQSERGLVLSAIDPSKGVFSPRPGRGLYEFYSQSASEIASRNLINAALAPTFIAGLVGERSRLVSTDSLNTLGALVDYQSYLEKERVQPGIDVA
ncbi:MAG: hypothetical protein HYW10_02760, partial [Candidatus Omnitrophica bacterium]|nr:hypothetical protein [Candidatus Omnitrophota bacterium]